MSGMITATVGAAVVGGVAANQAAKKQAKASGKASDAQVRAAEIATEEQRRQFDKMQELMKPYVEGGASAFQQQLAMSGALGAGARYQAQNAIMHDPAFQHKQKVAEQALLANASATGGLRGGNTQMALAELAPGMLADEMSQRYNMLGGISQMGQNSAAGVGSAGMNMASNIGNNAMAAGNAIGQNYVNQGNLAAQRYNTIGSIANRAAGAYAAYKGYSF